MESKWNQGQRKVIEYPSNSGALLVTAAAGSGKTSVVVERIISAITREENPADISRMLIVTFTNAAAEEMRGRIIKAITDVLHKAPQNKYLSRQLQLAESADILTIDAYYSRLMRANFHKIKISPDARIGDQNEVLAISEGVLDSVFEENYELKKPDFMALVSLLSEGRRDDDVRNMLLSSYSSIRSMIDPNEVCKSYYEIYEKALNQSPGETPWACYELSLLKTKLEYHKAEYSTLIPMLETDDKLAKAYLPAFADDADTIEKLLSGLSGDWDSRRDLLMAVFPKRLGTSRGVTDKALLVKAQSVRERWKKTIKAISDSLFTYTEDSIKEDIALAEPAIKALIRLIGEYDSRFIAEKTKKRILEFDDVTQYVYQLLLRKLPDGSIYPTEEASRIALETDEIIVDEYQDTNRLQDLIFTNVSRSGKNLIMVGDIKQSIYGFRYADPESFIEKLNRYVDTDITGDMPDLICAKKQSLNYNYRSSEAVIDFVNHIFGSLMKESFGGISYDESQKLVHGRFESETNGQSAELHIVDLSVTDLDTVTAEARVCAEYIKSAVASGEQISGKTLSYGDFAILIRSAKNKIGIYEKELSALGIPVQASLNEGLYSTPEGELILSLLSVVDNPYNDIALLGVIYSPLFNFSSDDLARIRIKSKKTPFITAIRVAAHDGDEKCIAFLNKLDSWRLMSPELRVGILIRRIYDDVSMPSLCSSGDNQEENELRLKNIYLIAANADKYEQRGGLSAFLRGVARMLENGRIEESAGKSGGSDSVKLMTIHKSKGLEFPVVILADSATQFYMPEKRSPVVFDKELGFGIKIRNNERGIRYPIISYEAVADKLEERRKEEELRILYVALTRARERICVFSSLANPSGKIEKLSGSLYSGNIEAREYISFSDWILTSVLCSGEGDELRSAVGLDAVRESHQRCGVKIYTHVAPSGENEAIAQETQVSTTEDEICDAGLHMILNEYEYKDAEILPTKMTATEIKKTLKGSELIYDDVLPTRKATEKPAFLSGIRLSPAERGTAIHTALQYIDIRKTHIDEVKEELLRLLAMKFITKEQFAAIDPKIIGEFLLSPLGARMRSAERLEREFKFTLLDNSLKYFPKLDTEKYGAEKLLLQGIIDCYFEEKGKLVIIDYKNDFIRNDDDIERKSTEHKIQLGIYAEALQRIENKEVSEKWLYFTSVSKAIRIIG